MIQVLTGVVMLSLSVYIYVSVAPIFFSERAEISYVFAVIGICGFNNICCFLFALKIRYKCLHQASKKSTRTLVFVWICVCFYITIYLIVLARLTRKVYKHVVRAMGHSFFIGMRKYLKDQIWKVSIDQIQYGLQCCGAHNYTEWHKTAWLDQSHINVKSELVKQFSEEGSWALPVVPWSCCRVSFPMQCLHDLLQQTRAYHVFADQPSIVTESLNTEGCLSKLKIPIKNALTAFILLVVLNCIVQVFIFIFVRILYTSCRNAAILNDPNGIAPGWVFGRGDCGYSRGQTLMEIMYPNGRDDIKRPLISEEDKR